MLTSLQCLLVHEDAIGADVLFMTLDVGDSPIQICLILLGYANLVVVGVVDICNGFVL